MLYQSLIFQDIQVHGVGDGFNNNDALLYFNKRAFDIVNDKLDSGLGRKPVQWDEMLTQFGEDITVNETTIQVWHGTDLIGDVIDAGFQGIFSPNTEWYLNHLEITWKSMYITEPTSYIKNKTNLYLLL